MSKAKEPGKKSKIKDIPLRERIMGGVPDDLWVKCPGCGNMLYRKELEENLKVCQRCGHHHRLAARERVVVTVDPESFTEHDAPMETADPLRFPDYKESLVRYGRNTGSKDSFIWGEATIGQRPVILGVSEFGFMGGSMGSVMGEKVSRAAEAAGEMKRPLILVCSGGGARMHEGIVSLMQMAKTTAAVTRLAAAKVPYIAVFTDPMLGGIAASFAFAADIIIAETGAIVGFAGPRVVEQAYKMKLPPGSMTAEFHRDHGMVDLVLTRKEMRPTLTKLMRVLKQR